MSDTRHSSILKYLRRALGAASDGSVTDAELLRRFVAQRDEAAFELLLWRHAAMVLNVCRRLLREADLIEDAFQATFLVFVRKASAISRRESLGGWLYRVAYRIALKAREQAAKRQVIEQGQSNLERPDLSSEDAAERELRGIVCEEVDRLPARYRTPIVTCFFEGKTHEEAASQLGWPRGTVASRLARGRELLRRRLLRRGIALSAGGLTLALAASPSPAALPALIRTTIQTMKLFTASSSTAAALPPRIADLTEGVLHAMYWSRMKLVMTVLLLVGLGGLGATLCAVPPGAEKPVDKPTPQVRAAEERDGDRAAAPEDMDKLTRDMAQSRLNLRKLALAMHAYAEKHNGALPAPAIYDKKGKALLSWRVALLPYLDQNNLYKQFHLDEPWDSEHNKKLLEAHVPKVYATPGRPPRPPLRTYYQVFVSPGPPGMGGGGVKGLPPGSPGAPPPPPVVHAAFVKGHRVRFPASIPDGTANTLLIVEAGNPVPWTKPEDLHYAEDEPMPELGGLFPDVFQGAFASGDVAVFTKKYNETQLRAAITANGGEVIDMEQILAPPRPRARPRPGDNSARDSDIEQWQQKNENLRRDLERARENLRRLKEERALQRQQDEQNQAKRDPRLEQLQRENARLQEELNKIHAESEAVAREIARRQKPQQQKGP